MDLLWKKESNDANALFIKLFDTNLTNEARQSPFKKNNVISDEHLRLVETKLSTFKHGKVCSIWDDPVDNCNAALRFAELETENVSKAYTARSECFLLLGNIKASLFDIEMAKSGNCPRNLLRKLKQIFNECQKLKNVLDKSNIIEHIPKLGSSPDPKFPMMSNKLKIQQNAEFGRHVVAKCDIAVGENVVVEESFSSATLFGFVKVCATCQAERKNFIACDKCTEVLFCDINCKNRNLFHDFMCGIELNMPKYHKIIMQTVLMAIGMFKSVDHLMKFIASVVAEGRDKLPDSVKDRQSEYRLFLKLNSHTGIVWLPLYFDMASKIYSDLLKLPRVREKFVAEYQQRFLMHLTLKHTLICNQNAFKSTQLLKTYMNISTASALFNHSCAPNLIHSPKNNVTIFTTSRPIKKGDQLFITYTGLDNKQEIQSFGNASKYGFECKCEKCEPRWKQSDRDLMKSDKNYQFLVKKQHEIENNETRSILMELCKRFLNKFGYLPWCDEIEFVIGIYSSCLTILYFNSSFF